MIEELCEEVMSEKMQIFFLWRKDEKYGVIQPATIPIIVNNQSSISSVFPLDIKVHFQKTIKHNFVALPYLEIPVELRLKNIYMKDPMKITINFSDSKENDGCWEGIVEKKVRLESQQECRVNVKYVVMRGGIYEISN